MLRMMEITPRDKQIHLRTLIGTILILLYNFTSTGALLPIQTQVIEQPINIKTLNAVNNTIEFIYQFTFDKTLNHSTNDVRVHVTTEGTESEQNVNFPVLFVVRQQKDVISWQLPQVSKFDSGKIYTRASRTLCSEINSGEPNYTTTVGYRDVEDSVTVTVSTASRRNVTFSIKVTVETNFVLSLDQHYNATVSPPSPRFYRFVFPKAIYSQYVLLEVTSDDTICMTVSVQNASCPIFDEESNVQYSGYWQTMTEKAGMTIRSDDFPNGFYIVFVVRTDDSACSKDRPHTYYELTSTGPFNERKKSISFSIHEKISQLEYIIAIFGTIGFFFLYYVFSIVIWGVYYFKVKPPECPSEESDIITNETLADEGQNGAIGDGEIYTTAGQLDPERQTQAVLPHHSRSRSRNAIQQRPANGAVVGSSSSNWLGNSDSDSSLDEVDIDFMDDVNRFKDVFRTSTGLRVSALARKNPRILAKKSELYLWTLLTVAVFYALPVVQLVLTYQKVLHSTGNQDLCYYNYLCSHPFWVISDFNHVYSNIGYIMLGLLFVMLVARKDRLHQKLELRTPTEYVEPACGIPRHYGLFYTMGAALVMEGILSGCYHVCPNGSNFQFDTSFMYVIAVMCILRIYQARHPDINTSAFVAFASLAFVILVGVVGIMVSSIYFWIVFTTFHIGFCLFLTVQIYYLGRWKLDLGLFSRIYMTWRNDCLASPLTCLRPLYVDRFILLTIANMVNWAVAALGVINFTQPKTLGISVDFATHLLFIFLSNLFLYTTFYILMKLAHREKIFLQPAIYIILSIVFWCLAGFAFLHKSTSWQLSPAESRTFNRECLILRFYDTHDLWHFLSASAMFFSFMMYLSLDDDLMATPRNRISVF